MSTAVAEVGLSPEQIAALIESLQHTLAGIDRD